MATPLRILIVEDQPSDCELIVRELRRSGFQPDWRRVDSEIDFVLSLKFEPEIILSDYSMPKFNGMRAFEIFKNKNLKIPFIFVSGTIGEEAAVEAMKRGVTDYLLKDRLTRLGSTITQALEQNRLQREHDAALEALCENEERFRLLAENIQEVFWILDPHANRMIYISPAYEEIWGRPSEALYESTQHWFSSAHPDDLSKVTQFFALIRQQGTHSVEFRIKKHDGSERWIHNRAFPVFLKSGTIDRIVGVAGDITDRKTSEEKCVQLEARLFQAQKMELMGTVSGGVAHDFNNILTPILGFCDLALGDIHCHPNIQQSLVEVKRAGLIAKDLVQRILTFSRFHKPERKTVNLAHVLADAVKLLRTTLPSTIQIHLDLLSPCPLTLADPIQIHQILLNLATNAVHAMTTKGGCLEIKLGEIEILESSIKPSSASEAGKYLVIIVKDNGIGMDEHVLQHIFDPFFTTKKCGEGTGLGLSIVQNMIEAHKGAITIESAPNLGATFTIYLPIIQTNEMTAEPLQSDHMPIGNGESILVIDDNEAIGHMMKASLKKLNYQVDCITSADPIVYEILENPSHYQLLITDQSMPRVTGLDLIKEIREKGSMIPIILMTGHSHQITQKTLDAFKNAALLKKPFELQELAVILRSLLDHPPVEELSL